MKSPQFGRSYLERYQDCAEAIEPFVSDLFGEGVALGWTPDEVATALINLASAYFPDTDHPMASAPAASFAQH